MYTITRNWRREIVIEKSRFICTLQKVSTEAEAQDFLKDIRKEFWDATHNCSAYIVDALTQRSSDDGEPGGTAGIPMLEVLRKNKLEGVAAVVTRYFGGIKLGAGGLVRAYSASVAGALAECGLSEKILMTYSSFPCPPESIGKVRNILYRQNAYAVADADYAGAKIILKLPAGEEEAAERWLAENLNMALALAAERSEYEEVPLPLQA